MGLISRVSSRTYSVTAVVLNQNKMKSPEKKPVAVTSDEEEDDEFCDARESLTSPAHENKIRPGLTHRRENATSDEDSEEDDEDDDDYDEVEENINSEEDDNEEIEKIEENSR